VTREHNQDLLVLDNLFKTLFGMFLKILPIFQISITHLSN